MPEQGPGNEPTTAIPALGNPPEGRRRTQPQNDDATTAIPVPKQDADAATEKLNTRDDEERKRRGGGVSAQDLLRREGRL
jgi:RND superfamily putative drug exporter